MKYSSLKAFAFAGSAALWAATVVEATPYATAVTNSGTSISFRLNESADSVKIISMAGLLTNELGPQPAGLRITNLVIVGTFQIEVNKGPSLGYLGGVTNQISADTNRNLRFLAPRGLAVNRNPASPYFGRIYVSNSDTGNVAASGSFPLRNMTNGDGIFLLNADFTDATGQGEVARTGGLDFRSTLTDQGNKPFRIEVGEDSNLYISDYTSATNLPLTGNLYVADPDVSPGSATNVFGFDPNNIGRVPSSAIVKGSLAGGDLTVFAVSPDKQYEYDFLGSPATSFSVMQKWAVGSGPLPSAAAPVRVTDLPILVADVPAVLSDIDIAPDGKYFLAQNRSDGFEAGLWVVDPASDANGSTYPDIVFNSYASGFFAYGVTNDVLRQTRAVKVAPDSSVVALIRDDNRIWIIPLTNGLPDLDARRLMDSGVTTTLGRDLSFDAAGNLYTASSGQAAVKSFSPGFASRAVTGSDGTFSVVRFTGNDLRLTMVDTNAAEPGVDLGEFMLTRSGDLTEPLSIRLTYSGTATYNVDYAALPTNVTLAAGVASTNIVVTPVDDGFGEALETVLVTVAPGTNYLVKGNNVGTAYLSDDGDPPSISVTGLDTNAYERMPNDSARFVLVRQTDSVSLQSPLEVTIAFAGTAVGGVDYEALATTVTLPAGQSRSTNAVVPIDNSLLDGSRTVMVTVQPAGGYLVDPVANTSTLRIRDDDVPAGPVLFSDDFDTDTAANYAVRFVAANGVDDKLVAFNFDYSAASIPSAPHSTGGTTRGLKLTVNKDATASAAGVNVYPTSVSFSNEFALRFDMYLTFNSAAAGTTESSIFGVNHSGNLTNRASLAGSDGVWFSVETDGSAASTAGASYGVYASTNPAVAPPVTASSARLFDTFFTSPPFLGVPGGSPSGQWVDVEVTQTNLAADSVITWKINAVLIQVRTNRSAFTNGTIMLGYMDTFNSIGSVNNFVLYDNVRVLNLTTPKPFIIEIKISPVGGTYQIDFTADPADAPGAFTLESSTALPGGFAADPGSSISSLGGGSFRALSPNSGDTQRFYRIRR